MELVAVAANIAARTILVVAFLVVSFVPAWAIAGRILEPTHRTRFRALCAAGLALLGYVSVVNLVGRLTRSSFIGVAIWFFLCGVASAFLLRRRSPFARAREIVRGWRAWAGLVV